MLGVPKDLDLSKFKGNFLSHVTVCQYQISFDFFEPAVSITAMGSWELKDASGNRVDGSDESPEYANRDACYCNRILGKVVKSVEIAPPHSISFHFESGHTLQIFDDLGPYDSIQIQSGDIYF
jgi:hypothetical protein